MGKYNVDLLKHDINKNFINQIYSSSFYPLITKLKRITRTTATLIYIIFLNEFDHKVRTGLLSSGLSRPDATLLRERNHCQEPVAFPSSMGIHVMPTSKRQIASPPLQPLVSQET